MFGKRFHLPCAAILLCLFPLPGAWSLYAQENQYAAEKEAALIKALAAEFTRGKAVIADAWIEAMAASLAGWLNDGQPVPESNLLASSNSSSPQHTQ